LTSRSAVSHLPILARHSVLIATLFLLAAMISLQGGASLAKSLFPLIGAPGATALRLAIGSLLMWIYFRPWRISIRTGNYLALLLYGISLGGMNYSFYMAIQSIPLGIAVALEFTGPLLVAMSASRRPLDFFWILLAAGGLYFLLPLGGNINEIDLKGAIYALMAGTCWAVYILAGKKAGSSYGAGTAALGSLVAALIFCPLGIWQAPSSLYHLSLLSLLPIGLAIALLSTALPYSLEMMALTRLPTKTFGTLTSMEPAVAALAGLLFLDEVLSVLQWLALTAVIIASVGASLCVHGQKAH
jgi:inner membrane transporter RhtA